MTTKRGGSGRDILSFPEGPDLDSEAFKRSFLDVRPASDSLDLWDGAGQASEFRSGKCWDRYRDGVVDSGDSFDVNGRDSSATEEKEFVNHRKLSLEFRLQACLPDTFHSLEES